MKASRKDGKWVFAFGKKQKLLLLALLQLYPRIPPAHHRLTKSPPPGDDTNQRLLEDALADQRRENKANLSAFLADPARLRETESGCQITLNDADLEWLLQVLNDVRVGSWVLLGSPESDLPELAINEQTAPHIWAMHVAGHFQMQLLEAVQSPDTE